jgi:hypothetical protein
MRHRGATLSNRGIASNPVEWTLHVHLGIAKAFDCTADSVQLTDLEDPGTCSSRIV